MDAASETRLYALRCAIESKVMLDLSKKTATERAEEILGVALIFEKYLAFEFAPEGDTP